MIQKEMKLGVETKIHSMMKVNLNPSKKKKMKAKKKSVWIK